MKTLFTAVTSVLLVSLFHKVHPSNPDSEPVQNTSASDVLHEQKRSAPFRVVEVSRERTTYFQRNPGLTFVKVVGPVQKVKELSPMPQIGIEATVYNERGLPVQNIHFNSYNGVQWRSDRNTNIGWNRNPPRWPTYPSNTPSDSSFNRDAINGNEDSFVKRPVHVPSNAYNPERRISPDWLPTNPPNTPSDSTYNRGVINGNEDSFVNRPVHVPSNAYNPERRISPDWLPTNPPNTPSDSTYNRGVINGNEDSFVKRPVYVPFNAYNPKRRISPDWLSTNPPNTPSDSSYNRNEKRSTRRPGSDTFDAPKTVGKNSPDSSLYASIINDFGFELIERMNLKTNFVLSPLSIFLALSMCYLGSSGTTKVQLEEVMGLNQKSVHGQTFHQGMKDLLSSILLESSNYELYLANGLFFGKNFEYIKEFKEDILKFYDGKVESLDFENPQQSASVIDKWVSRITRNMIPKLSEGAPSLLTRLLVVNAIFFKGIWKTQFPPSMTFDGKFFSSVDSEKMVRTMQLFNETFPFYRSQDHRTSFIKLPYEGDQISLIIALPSTIGENPMPNMRDELLCSVRDALNDTTIGNIAIPKFGFDYKLSLIQPLEQLGITHLFNIDKANLGQMTPENVAVSDMLHKAVIDIDEQGTSASASTTIQLTFQTKKKDPDFIANHPFAFYIVHEPTGVVLFSGKIFDIGQRRGEVPNNRRDSNTQGVPENARSTADLSKIRRG